MFPFQKTVNQEDSRVGLPRAWLPLWSCVNRPPPFRVSLCLCGNLCFLWQSQSTNSSNGEARTVFRLPPKFTQGYSGRQPETGLMKRMEYGETGSPVPFGDCCASGSPRSAAQRRSLGRQPVEFGLAAFYKARAARRHKAQQNPPNQFRPFHQPRAREGGESPLGVTTGSCPTQKLDDPAGERVG